MACTRQRVSTPKASLAVDASPKGDCVKEGEKIEKHVHDKAHNNVNGINGVKIQNYVHDKAHNDVNGVSGVISMGGEVFNGDRGAKSGGDSTSFDERLGRAIFDQVQANKNTLKLFLEVVTISVDEALNLGVPYMLVLLAFGLRVALALSQLLMGRADAAKEVFSGRTQLELVCASLIFVSCLGCACEIFLKLAFKRDRPWYLVKKSTYVLPGEKYSMPSGHSLRAATLAFWLMKDEHTLSTLWGTPPSTSVSSGQLSLLAAWVALAMLSRVGLGKHYPLDVVAGLACGILNGCLLTYSPPFVVYMAKMIGGTICSLTWGEFYFLDLLAKHTGLPRKPLSPLFWFTYVAVFGRWLADCRHFL